MSLAHYVRKGRRDEEFGLDSFQESVRSDPGGLGVAGGPSERGLGQLRQDERASSKDDVVWNVLRWSPTGSGL